MSPSKRMCRAFQSYFSSPPNSTVYILVICCSWQTFQNGAVQKSRILLSLHMNVRIDSMQLGGSLVGALVLLCQLTAEGWMHRKASYSRVWLLGWHGCNPCVGWASFYPLSLSMWLVWVSIQCGRPRWSCKASYKGRPRVSSLPCKLVRPAWIQRDRGMRREASGWGNGLQGGKKVMASVTLLQLSSLLTLFPNAGFQSCVVALLG